MQLKKELDDLAARGQAEQVSLAELIDALGARSQALVCCVLCIPFLQPIPLAGLSTILGTIIMMLGYCIARDRPLWMPEKLRSRQISGATLRRIATTGQKLVERISRYIKPRGAWLRSHPGLKMLNGAIIAINGLLLSLPLPIPFTNTLPALAASAIAVGLVEEDGVFIVFGYVFFIVSLAYFTAIGLLPFLGYEMFTSPR